MQSPGEVVLSLGDFNGHVRRQTDGFVGVNGKFGIGKRNAEGRRLLQFCDESCAWQTHGLKRNRDK